jgi:DNA-binding winged helix-turn-helix (wHTH) protein/Tol biopolymer transport system component
LAGGVFEFGDFKLDGDRFDLSRGGRTLKLERKPMELLLLLATSNGQLVTRAEIARHLWGTEVFVDTEHGINTAVRKIRQVLGDDSENPRFVQTVTGKGYRFAAPITQQEPLQESALPAAPPIRRTPVAWYVVGGVCTLLAIAVMAIHHSLLRRPEIRYTQLTDFTDSAVSPTLSPDGRMLAFIRGSNSFLSADQIYVKMLPNGEARRLVDDGRPKYGLAFSPDGSEIAYTVLEAPTFSTYTVSVLGGDSHLFVNNAAGLSWLDPHQLLFSRIRSGIHLGVVTQSVTDGRLKEIYFPSHERGMAHYSYPSPDHRWILVVEMDENGDWAPCRLVSLDGKSQTRSVGPTGACASAAWSPDGSWMYFAASLEGHSHLWRQHFPGGSPEQITFGPTDQEGVAVEKTGRALITSVGVHESNLWIHDENGERPLSSEGEVVAYSSPPTFSKDDKTLYYLLKHPSQAAGAELWSTILESGKNEAVFPGISMLAYDVSPDGKQAVYSAAGSDGKTQMWLAPLDRSSPARRVGNIAGMSPHFGANGQIFFLLTEGNANFLEQVRTDGSGREKVVPYPIVEIQGISPSRRWVMAMVAAAPGANGPAPMAIPVDGGPPRRICISYCSAKWSSSGRFLFVPVEDQSRTGPGRSLAIPIGPGESLRDFPPEGIAPLADVSVAPGTQSVPRANLVPGKDPAHFAYVNTTVHRNLYRISLPSD